MKHHILFSLLCSAVIINSTYAGEAKEDAKNKKGAVLSAIALCKLQGTVGHQYMNSLLSQLPTPQQEQLSTLQRECIFRELENQEEASFNKSRQLTDTAKIPSVLLRRR